MGTIQVSGGKILHGEVTIQGAKNAALPLMAAALLHKGTTVLHNCPHLLDVECMRAMLEDLGCRTVFEGKDLYIDATQIQKNELDVSLTAKMRGSVLLMGSLLGRCREVILPFPGGCVIGARPVNYHLSVMQQLGAEVICQEERMILRAQRLSGGNIVLPFPSVGATENAILAGVLARGETHLNGCAMEPEIEELCRFLKEKGAAISHKGDGIHIKGEVPLCDSEYTLMPDRIVAGTYLLALCAAKGSVVLHQVPATELKALNDIVKNLGVRMQIWDDVQTGYKTVKAETYPQRNQEIKVKTAPYPGFPTDLQSQLMAVTAAMEGQNCHIREQIFENRFMIVKQLQKMGADIQVSHNEARVCGKRIHGARLQAQDLRGGAALILAAMGAEGESRIAPDEYIKRGYEDISRDLKALGAGISSTEKPGQEQ